MGTWPGVIIEKLGYFELEAKEYLGEDLEMCFSVIGDAYADSFPALQVRPFTKGTELVEELLKLKIVGQGGGQTTESYELAVLYFVRNVLIPNAKRPILIIIGDEQPYDFVDKDQAKSLAHVNLEGRMSTKEVFEELKRKFSVNMIRKPYNSSSGNSMSDLDRKIYGKWAELVGAENIYDLPDPARVVDLIFGILAKETGRMEYFHDEIEGRQRPDQVAVVYKSLDSVHRLSDGKRPELRSGDSRMHRPMDGEETKPLI